MTTFTLSSTNKCNYCTLQIEVNNCLYTVLLSDNDLEQLKAQIRIYESEKHNKKRCNE